MTTTGPWASVGPLPLQDVSIQVDVVGSDSDPLALWAIGTNGDVLCRTGVTKANPKVRATCLLIECVRSLSSKAHNAEGWCGQRETVSKTGQMTHCSKVYVGQSVALNFTLLHGYMREDLQKEPFFRGTENR